MVTVRMLQESLDQQTRHILALQPVLILLHFAFLMMQEMELLIWWLKH
jgi:hypothetical protein